MDFDNYIGLWLDCYYIWVPNENAKDCKRYYILDKDKNINTNCSHTIKNYLLKYNNKIRKLENATLRKNGYIIEKVTNENKKHIQNVILNTYKGESSESDEKLARYIYNNIPVYYKLPGYLKKYYEVSYPLESLKNIKKYRKVNDIDLAQLAVSVTLYANEKNIDNFIKVAREDFLIF